VNALCAVDEVVPGLADTDGDGFSECSRPMPDCDDDPSDDPPDVVCPDNPESCTQETTACAICIYPGAPEFPNDGIDNDCDGFLMINPELRIVENDHLIIQWDQANPERIISTYFKDQEIELARESGEKIVGGSFSHYNCRSQVPHNPVFLVGATSTGTWNVQVREEGALVEIFSQSDAGVPIYTITVKNPTKPCRHQSG
jgi:hypothetical protein